MNKRLVAFGCSFAYGHGLEDCFVPPVGPGKRPSKYAWPNLLAKYLGRECVNLSRPGASNKEIWYTIINTKFQADDLVVVGWTNPNRWCVINSINPNDSPTPIGPWMHTKQSNALYTHLFSGADSVIDLNLRIDHAATFLDRQNVLQLHTHIDTRQVPKLTWRPTNLVPYRMIDLVAQHPKALDNSHPGSEAHKEYAELLFKYIQEQT